jgi:hypothetical protein
MARLKSCPSPPIQTPKIIQTPKPVETPKPVQIPKPVQTPEAHPDRKHIQIGATPHEIQST